MSKIMSMLANMDQKQLEDGLKKASKILEASNKEDIIKQINKNMNN